MATATILPFKPGFGSDPANSYGPSSGFFSGLNPQQGLGGINSPFGRQQQGAGPFNIGAPGQPLGSGLYGLPQAFTGWSGPARYAFAPALQYASQAQPAQDLYRNQMTTDWASQLYGASADVINAQSDASRSRMQQGLARAGYGGGGTISPFMSSQIQAEGLARAGQLGTAARQSILQGQQMSSEAARNYLNSLAQNLQAFLTPAQLETSRQARVPTTSGVNYIGPAIGAFGSIAGGALQGAGY